MMQTRWVISKDSHLQSHERVFATLLFSSVLLSLHNLNVSDHKTNFAVRQKYTDLMQKDVAIVIKFIKERQLSKPTWPNVNKVTGP